MESIATLLNDARAVLCRACARQPPIGSRWLWQSAWTAEVKVIATLFVLLAGIDTSNSAVAVQSADKIETYSISGSSVSDLGDQIALLGPVDVGDGHRHAGYTRWHIEESYSFEENGKLCRIADVHISITTVLTLLEWSNKDRASAGLQERWSAFIGRLREHEAGHQRNGMSAAQEVREILIGVAPEPDCKSMGLKLDSQLGDVLARHRQADLDYDAQTSHGAKQGAVLE